MCYVKKKGFKIEFLKFLDGSAWFCVEKLKKHVFDTKKTKKLTEYIQKIIKIHKTIAFIGAFKVPCTLP